MILLSPYHRSLKPEFAPEPGICTQTGHTQAAPSSTWTCRMILMSAPSSISIIFDRTDYAAFARFAKGSAREFLHCGKLPCGRDTLMRRCVAGLGFIIVWTIGLAALGQPRHAAEFAIGGRCKSEHGRGSNRRVVGPCHGNPIAQRRIWPKIRLYEGRALREILWRTPHKPQKKHKH